MKFSEETVDEVGMLLMHLYTLDDPNFNDTTTFTYPYNAAESALKLGDKYNLPDLSAKGQQYISMGFENRIDDWEDKTDDQKRMWINRLKRLWRMNCAGSKNLQGIVVHQLTRVSRDIIEHELFQKLCKKTPEFAFAFMRALAKELEEANELNERSESDGSDES